MTTEKTCYELHTTVEPNRDANINWQPPPDASPYQLTWLVVPDDVAPHFYVADIKVGKNSQLCSAGVLPASLFAASEPEVDLGYDVCLQGTYINVYVINATNTRQVFRCSLVGRHVEDNTRHPKNKKVILGLGSTSIQPRSENKLHVQSLIQMTPEQLFVPPRLLEKVTIKSVTKNRSKVDQASLTRQNLLTPPRTIELSPDKILHYHEYLTIVVENNTDSPLLFTGAVTGLIPPRKPIFTVDLFSRHVPAWLEHVVPRLQGRPGARWLEVGSFEGQSALWTLENVLTGEGSCLTCVDVFDRYAPGIELWGGGNREYENVFNANLSEHPNVVKLVGRGIDVLPHVKTAGLRFDGGYLDVGIELSPDELELMWDLMDPGAVVVVNTYGSLNWPRHSNAHYDVLYEGTCLILLKAQQP